LEEEIAGLGVSQ